MNYVRELRTLVGHRPLIIPSAAVLILNDENCLLMQHRQDNQLWGLIGGSMEIGESLEETAKREVREETNLELDELNWFNLFSGKELIYTYPHGDVIANVVAVYISRKFRGILKVNKLEGDELRFFETDKLPEDISPPDQPIVESFLAYTKNFQ